MDSEKLDFDDYAVFHYYYSSSDLDPEIKKIIENYPNKKIKFLDIGAGDANLVFLLKKNYPNISITVSDISQKRLNRIEKKLGKKSSYVLDDICKTKFPKNHFDIVNSDQVIEHVDSDNLVVENIKKILKKKGQFKVLSVYKKKWAWYFYRCNGKWVLDPTHVREYESIEEYKNLFERNGLIVKKCYTSTVNFQFIDPVLRLFKIRKLNSFLEGLRKLKIRIPGYFTIHIVGTKK